MARDTAIRSALEAEKAARDAVDEARRQAQVIREEARERARRIEDRTEQRIRRLHAAVDAEIERRKKEIDTEGAEMLRRLGRDIVDESKVEQSIDDVIRRLLDGETP